MSKTSTLKAAAGLVENDDNILLVQLPQWYANEAEKWVLPGGMVDSGETPQQAVLREIAEETNIEVEVTEQLFIDKSSSAEMHFFKCRYVAGEIIHQADELDSAQWIPIIDLVHTDLGYNNYSLLKRWGYIR
ncbi:TPA: NUDIX hydrolase [Candidatus Saccharibacteria bacterium]|nr:NUDIX hydrolase [Candidatus Saccharibacteria bacterium]HIO87420.1 NUDIX hydrolase [Candidatus Saccharibacteria bacterium]